MAPKKSLVYFCITLSMVFWSLSFIWGKILLDIYSPFTIITIRLIIASIFLTTLSLLLKKLQKIKKEDFKLFLILVLFEPFMYFLGETFGLNLVSSTVASVIISTIPLFTPIAAFYVLKERLSWLNFIGIFISVIGVLLVIVQKDFSITASPKGLLLLFLAVIAAIGYTIFLKKLTVKYNAYTIISYQNILGAIYFLPFFLFFDLKEFMTIPFSLDAFIPLVELAVFASSFAFVLYTYGVTHLGVSKASIFTNFIPVFTIIFAYFLINEPITIQRVIGIIVVVSGVTLSQIKLKLKNAI